MVFLKIVSVFRITVSVSLKIMGFLNFVFRKIVFFSFAGVATFTRDNSTPCKAEDGLSGLGPDQHKDQSIGQYDSSEFTDEELMSLDREGRSVMTQHRIRYHMHESCVSFENFGMVLKMSVQPDCLCI